jgi:hypothetical protein
VTIQEFAANYRLHTRLDDDQTTIIPGRYGHIFEWDNQILGVMIMLQPQLKFPPPDQPQPPIKKPQYWNYQRRAFQHAGFTITQDGSYEGSATFDPSNPLQAKIAIRSARIKTKRILSEPDRLRLSQRMQAFNKTKPSPSTGLPAARKHAK